MKNVRELVNDQILLSVRGSRLNIGNYRKFVLLSVDITETISGELRERIGSQIREPMLYELYKRFQYK